MFNKQHRSKEVIYILLFFDQKKSSVLFFGVIVLGNQSTISSIQYPFVLLKNYRNAVVGMAKMCMIFFQLFNCFGLINKMLIMILLLVLKYEEQCIHCVDISIKDWKPY